MKYNTIVIGGGLAYNKVDAQLAPPGKSVAAVCGVDHLKNWEGLTKEAYKAKKEEVAQLILQRLEKQFPGIREHIEYYEVATPKTMQRYTSNPSGSVYGYAQTKEQTATKRFRNNFLIPNLYFASAWASPGGGFEGSIMGGFLAALQMSKDKIWSGCDADKFVDERIVKFLEQKQVDTNILELSFEKPAGFQHQNGQFAILNLLKPKIIELDLPYRWLQIASAPEEPELRFSIELNQSSFHKSCQLLNIGDEALIFGPTG